MKKILSIILAVLLTAGTLTGCAAQANTPEQIVGVNTNVLTSTSELENVSSGSFSNEDYQKLSALKFDDYQHMTVSKFQNMVWSMTDTVEYRDLLERFSKDEVLYQLKDSNETAWFLFYILRPLTAENWQTQIYSGAAESDLHAPNENARLEYTYTLTILAPDKVTVKDYNDMRLSVKDALNDILRNRTKEDLQNETLMQTELKTYIDEILPDLQTPEVSIAIEYAYFPMPPESGNPANDYLPNTEEQRRSPTGTEEDYRSLLAMRTADYAAMSVADFNAKLLAWANEDFDRMERIDSDTQWNDFRVDLSEEERNFVRLTVFLSGSENGAFIQSNYTGEPEAAPIYQESLPQKKDMSGRSPMWCDFGYQFSYHIENRETLTVGERDHCVGGMINAVEKFWSDTALDDLLIMTKNDIVSRLLSLAAEYSADGITITISEEKVLFEHINEKIEMP